MRPNLEVSTISLDSSSLHTSNKAANNNSKLHDIPSSTSVYLFSQSLSQNVSTADGTEHTQHKQMNILQTRTSNGSALQVVRAQTFQTSSSRRATCNTTSSYSQFTNYSDDFQHPVISSGSDSSSGCELMVIKA